MKIGDNIQYKDMQGEVLDLVGHKLHIKWDDNTFGYVPQAQAHLITKEKENGDQTNKATEEKPKRGRKKKGQ